jgi:hypothetical protein
MSFTSQQKDGTAVIAGNTEIPLTKGVGYKARGMITAPAMQNTLRLSSVNETT